LNYRYVPDPNLALSAILDQNPAASLEELRRSNPALRAMSIDHLTTRLAQLSARREPALTRTL